MKIRAICCTNSIRCKNYLTNIQLVDIDEKELYYEPRIENRTNGFSMVHGALAAKLVEPVFIKPCFSMCGDRVVEDIEVEWVRSQYRGHTTRRDGTKAYWHYFEFSSMYRYGTGNRARLRSLTVDQFYRCATDDDERDNFFKANMTIVGKPQDTPKEYVIDYDPEPQHILKTFNLETNIPEDLHTWSKNVTDLLLRQNDTIEKQAKQIAELQSRISSSS